MKKTAKDLLNELIQLSKDNRTYDLGNKPEIDLYDARKFLSPIIIEEINQVFCQLIEDKDDREVWRILYLTHKDGDSDNKYTLEYEHVISDSSKTPQVYHFNFSEEDIINLDALNDFIDKNTKPYNRNIGFEPGD